MWAQAEAATDVIAARPKRSIHELANLIVKPASAGGITQKARKIIRFTAKDRDVLRSAYVEAYDAAERRLSISAGAALERLNEGVPDSIETQKAPVRKVRMLHCPSCKQTFYDGLHRDPKKSPGRHGCGTKLKWIEVEKP